MEGVLIVSTMEALSAEMRITLILGRLTSTKVATMEENVLSSPTA